MVLLVKSALINIHNKRFFVNPQGNFAIHFRQLVFGIDERIEFIRLFGVFKNKPVLLGQITLKTLGQFNLIPFDVGRKAQRDAACKKRK